MLLPLWRWVPKWLASRRKAELDKLYRKLQEIDLAVSSAADQPAEMRVHLSRLNHFERDLRLVHRKRISAEHFMEFRRDIDRIRNRGLPTLSDAGLHRARRQGGGHDAGAGGAAHERSSAHDRRERETAIGPTTPEEFLARIQSNLDALSRVPHGEDAAHRHGHLAEHLAPIREQLANARRSLLHLSRPADSTLQDADRADVAAHEIQPPRSARFSDRIQTITTERTAGRDTSIEADRDQDGPASRQASDNPTRIRPANS